MSIVENRNFYLEIEDKVQTQSQGVQTQETPIGGFPELGTFCQRLQVNYQNITIHNAYKSLNCIAMNFQYLV